MSVGAIEVLHARLPAAPAAVTAPRVDGGRVSSETARAVVAVGVAALVVALLLGGVGLIAALPSAFVAGALTALLAVAMGRAADSALPIGRIALVVYSVAACLGAVVIANNQLNYGIPYTISFDDSFYWFNTESIARGGTFGAQHATLFEYVAAGYYTLLTPLGEVAPADLLPLNWGVSALAICAVLILSEHLVGRPPPLALALLATYGNAQFFNCVPHLYRDMLVTLGFALAVLFAVRGRFLLALLGVAVALATRTAHGFLAAVTVFGVMLSQTTAFSRHPKVIAVGIALVVLAGVAVVSRGSAAMLSGRSGETDTTDVASYAFNRQQAVVAHLSDSSSLGAQVIALGPAGIPLRMISGYFAPVTLVNPVVQRSYNTMLIPGRLGDALRVRRFVVVTLVYWVTVLSWPVLAAGLLLGMRRLERAGGTSRTLIRLLLLSFFFIMTVSMQERHRVPIIVFNPLFLSAWHAAPASPDEQVAGRVIRWGAVLLLGALNLWFALR